MRRPAAYASLAAIFVCVVGADYFALTSGGVLSFAAARQVDAAFGDRLEHGPVTASLDGLVVLRDVRLNPPVLKAVRVEIRPESVTLVEPRVTLTSELIRLLANEPRGPALRDVYPHDLPRVSCSGGHVEIAHPAYLRSLQAFAIQELVMAPVGGCRYLVEGNLRSEILGEWRVSGNVDVDKGAVHLTLATEEVHFGPAMRAALSDDLLSKLDRYRPNGPAAARVQVDIEPDTPPQFRVTVEPRGMVLCYAGFPYPVEDARGEVDFLPDRIVVKALSARSGTARVRFDGSTGGYGPEADFNFRIEIDSLPMDDTLRAALSPDAREVYDRFHASGTADVRGSIVREYGIDKPARNPLNVSFRDASFQYADFPYAVDHVRGEIHIDSPRIEVKRLTGRHDGGAIALEGAIDVGKDPTLDLLVRGERIALDIPLRDALPKKALDIWKRFLPSGTVDVDWRLNSARDDEVTVTARECIVEIAQLPLKICHVRGVVSYGSDGVKLDNLAGRIGDEAGEVAISGNLTEECHVTLRDVRIDKRLRQAIRLLDALQLHGSASGTVDIETGATATKWTMRLHLPDAGIDTVKGEFTIDATTGEFSGRSFEIDQVDLRKYIPNRKLAGKASLEICDLKGRGNDLASLTGAGSLTITDGDLFDMPAAINILSPFSEKKKFDRGKVVFDIKDGKFLISDLGFYSREGGSVAGGGEVTFAGRYDLNLKLTLKPLLNLNFFLFDIPAIILGEFTRKHVVGDLQSSKPDEEK